MHAVGLRVRVAIGSFVVGLSIGACQGSGDSDTRRPTARPSVALPDDALSLGCRLQEGSGSSRSDRRFRAKSLVIGPVVLFPVRSEYPRLAVEELGPGRFALSEMLVALARDEIAEGERVELRVDPEAEAHAAFYSSRVAFKPNGYRVAEGAPALVVEACAAAPGLHGYTTYNVGFLADSARCIPISVSIEGRSVGTGVVRFGRRNCPV
jgi:hypothetical protein